MDYQKLYHILFNAVTDSLENMAEQNFGQAAACLRQAQQTCEELYMDREESPAQ